MCSSDLFPSHDIRFRAGEKFAYDRIKLWLLHEFLPEKKVERAGLTGLQVKSLVLNEAFSVIGRSSHHVPSCILKSPKFVVIEYLKGLFISSGSFSVEELDDMFSFTTVHSELSRQVHLLLNELGVISYRRVKENLDGYEVLFSNSFRERFIDKEGWFVNELGVICAEVVAGFMEDEVEEVCLLGDMHTWGLELLGENVHITNGLLTHNTPLVSYEFTPLRGIERRTAKASLANIKSMQRFIKRMRELGIRTGFNGRGIGTFMEQMLLDIGRKGTNQLLNLAIKNIHCGWVRFNDRYCSFGKDIWKYFFNLWINSSNNS